MSKAPLGALQAFVVAARTGNLSRAAERLHVTVSALSHQIRKLEDRLSRRLFERSPRGVVPTLEGQRLLEAVGVHIDGIERAMTRLRVRCDDRLTISVLPSMASSWLIPRLPRFTAAHPEVQLSLSSNIELVDFDAEPIDAALRFGPGSWPGVEAVHLFDEWVVPVASPGFLKKHGRPAPARLGEWPLLGDPADRWKDWFAKFGGAEPSRYVASFTDSELLLRAAAEGLGIALGRMTLAQGLLEAGRLIALSPERLKAEYAHYLVFPPRSAEHRGLKSFRAFVEGEAAEYVREMSAAGRRVTNVTRRG